MEFFSLLSMPGVAAAASQDSAAESYSIWDLLDNGRSIGEYWMEWATASNPWRAALYDGDWMIELRILALFAAFIILHVVMTILKEKRILGPILASRPTLVANQLHCTSVSFLAVYLLLTGDPSDVRSYEAWQHWGIPISMAYFLGDFVWYVIPSRHSPLSASKGWDVLIGFHHVTMLACHYPVATDAGAELCGAGSALWSVRLSLLGYLCELSNPLMNYRWWLMQTLDRHRADFSVTVTLLVLSFAARVFLLGYLLVGYILPEAAKFIEAKQVFIYVMCVIGHAVILVLSLYWLKVLTKPGLQRMLVFTPQPKKGKIGGGFTFGTDMGRSAPKANKSD